jgi:hypothetical protein
MDRSSAHGRPAPVGKGLRTFLAEGSRCITALLSLCSTLLTRDTRSRKLEDRKRSKGLLAGRYQLSPDGCRASLSFNFIEPRHVQEHFNIPKAWR